METPSKPINHRNVGEEVHGEERIAPDIITPPNLSSVLAETHFKKTNISKQSKSTSGVNMHLKQPQVNVLRDEPTKCKKTRLSLLEGA